MSSCHTFDGVTKGPGKQGHIVADTLLPMMFLGLRKLGNICCGHKMFPQQCVLVCQGLNTEKIQTLQAN